MKHAAKSGTAIASAAFALAMSSAAVVAPTEAAASDDAKIHCMGVNTCAGTSDCATASNSCAGQNSCKGQGFLSMTKAECDEAGGTVES